MASLAVFLQRRVRQLRLPLLLPVVLLSQLLLLLCGTAGEVAEHRVEALPGLGAVGARRQWSGYVEVPAPWLNTSVFVHYWLLEGDADSGTLAWFQGGPGSSSLLALLTENGPITLNDFSLDAEPPTVFANPHGWQRAAAQVLYIEHPAPAGFSYCAPNPCRWNDTSQAWVSYSFMERFFRLYPELQQQPLHLTGESYAGVLVPTLAHEILAHRNPANERLAPWNLRGFAVGNACPGNRVHTCTPYSGWIGAQVAVDFRYGHGMISDSKYAAIQAACAGHWGTFEAPPQPCRDLLEDPIRPVLSEAGDTYDMGGGYHLYDTCMADLSGRIDKATHRRVDPDVTDLLLRMRAVQRRGQEQQQQQQQQQRLLEATPLPRPNSGEYWCGQERVALIYLNRPDVQAALHVRPTKFEFSKALDYNYTAHSLVELYKEELSDAFDILQFSGDADPCVPYVGTQRWVDSLGLATEQPWHPWASPDANQPAGYLHVMHSNNRRHKFAFATIRNAGHMSMRYKPEAALHLLRQWLQRWPR